MRLWKYLLSCMLGWALRIFGTILLSTCRVNIFGREIEKKYFEENPDQSLIYASWHRGVIYNVFFYRNQPFVGMASTSDDGEIAAQGAKRFGWKVVRGSSTRRGSQVSFRHAEGYPVMPASWWMPPRVPPMFLNRV